MITVDDIAATVTALRAQGHRFRNEPLRGPAVAQVLAEEPSGSPIDLPIDLFEPART